jgi:hypothetical protein
MARTTTTKKPAAKKAAAKKPGKTKADIKAARDAALAKARVAREAKAKEKAAEKAIAAAAKAKETAKVEKELAPLAKDINARFASAMKTMEKADDMRLAAALQLAAAEKLCEAAGIKFRTWAEANITEQTWRNVRLLLPVGRAGADKGTQMLEDMRKGNADRNKAHRDKKKAEPRSLPSPSADVVRAPKVSEFRKIEEQVQLMPDIEQKAIAETALHKLGFEVAPAGRGAAFQKMQNELEQIKIGGNLAAAKAAFDGLSAKDKMSLVEYAAKVVGCKIEMPSFGGTGEMPELPAGLDRSKTEGTAGPGRRRRAAAAA